MIKNSGVDPVLIPHHISSEKYFPERKENISAHSYAQLIKRESK